MTKLMEKTNQDSEFAKLFENYDYNFKVADVVKGTIVKKKITASS